MAGRIPQSFIDDVLGRIDLVELVGERVELKKAGRSHKGLCPFHAERTPSFHVDRDRQFYYCFGCQASGTAITFLMQAGRMEFLDALEELAERVGLKLPAAAAGDERHGSDRRLLELLAAASRHFGAQLRRHPSARAAIDYLKGRGVTGEMAQRHALGWAPPGWELLLRALGGNAETERDLAAAGLLVARDDGSHYDRFRERIMFPIRDLRGRVLGFGGRVLGREEPKYLNSPETPVFHKGRELYGLYEARQAKGAGDAAMLVVEGYMDVIALAQHGVTQVVATLGTATTPEHVERLFRLVPDVVFCFDGDAAGRRAAWRALETVLPQLRDGRAASFLFLPEGEDPDSLVRSRGAEHFLSPAARTPSSTFLFEGLAREVDAGTPEGAARLVDRARPLIAKVPAGALRRLLLHRLEERSGLSVPELSRIVGDAPPGPAAIAAPAAPSQRPRPAGKAANARESLADHIVGLLIRRPDLAGLCAELEVHPAPADADAPLLDALLGILRGDGALPEATLIARLTESPGSERLPGILRRADVTPEAGIARELTDAVARLCDLRARAPVTLPGEGLPSALDPVTRERLRRRGRATSMQAPDTERDDSAGQD